MPAEAHNHHDHHHHRSASQTRLAVTMLLVAIYMVAEFVGGWLTNSLALMADAGHMLSDAAALALSLFAIWIARRPATARHTYGFYRAEILAAVVNGATLIGVSFYIFVEAYHRFSEPPEVLGPAMLGIAAGGLAVNLVSLWFLGGHDHGDNLNVRGARLHVLTDLLGSIGAITAAAMVWAFDWRWADPLTSIAIGILVIYSSWRLLVEAVRVLMEGAPAGIDVDEVLVAIREQPGVAAVHDLHVWSITSGRPALSVHVVTTSSEYGAMLTALRQMLHDRFGMHHSTIQLEPEHFDEHCEGEGCGSGSGGVGER